MRARDHISSVLRPTLALLLAAAIGAGCDGNGPGVKPENSTLTVTFTPAAVSVDGLTLTKATLTIDHVEALGNAPPPHPPPGPMPPDHLTLDLQGAGDSLTIDVPPGLYSRVGFHIEDVSLAGTWKGMPLSARLAMFQGPRVDLRSATPVEVTSGGTATLSVSVDPAQWFAAPSPLDSATVAADGSITCNDQQNQATAAALLDRVPPSFSLK